MHKRFLLLLSLTCTVLFLTMGCHHKKNKITANSTLYTSQLFSDCAIDSNYVKKELEKDSTLHPYADDILAFYQRRNFESAWLDHDTFTLGAHDFLNTLSNFYEEFGDSSLIADLDGTEVSDMLLSSSPDWRTMQDLKLTATFFRYAERAYSGTSKDPKDLEWFIPRMKKDYQRLLDSLVTSPASYSVYEPVNKYYKALKNVLSQYRAIEKKGGWLQIKASSLPIQIGDSSANIIALKTVLHSTGDYTSADMTMLYTDSLGSAVTRYQHRMGLRETGKTDSLTLAEINIPVSERIRQIMLNMERLRWMPDSLPAHYLLVNIPEYRLHVYDNDTLVWNMDVVVGNAATRTSVFTGRLSVVDFCPYWNVPQSIIKNELLPKLRKNANYLSHLNMEVKSGEVILDGAGIDWGKYTNGVPFVIRQKPGPQNSLGEVAFFFPNSFDIFLHDTPAKSFFNESNRAFSHGCIRLSEPKKLAAYIFKKDSTMQPDDIRALLDKRMERKVSVRPSIPVYIVYFTAWVDTEGKVCFRHDVYGHDAKLANEIFGK